MKRVDDFRLKFGKQELVPIMIGGMGVDISTAELALEAARLGGVGHISDAMLPTVFGLALRDRLRQDQAAAIQVQHRQLRQDRRQVRSRPHSRIHPPAREQDHGSQARLGHDLHQLHGKAHHERAERDAQGAAVGSAVRRYRRRHPGGGSASGFVRTDRRPSALPRRQIGHHRFLAARTAIVPAQECAHQPAARLHRGGRSAGRRTPRFRPGRLDEIRPAHDHQRDPPIPARRETATTAAASACSPSGSGWTGSMVRSGSPAGPAGEPVPPLPRQ